MTRYTVHQRKRATDRIDLIDDIVVLKDGYSWGAFWLGPLWLFNQGAFAAGFVDLLVSLLFADLMLADSGFISTLGLGGLMATRIFFGFEGYDALRDLWQGRGYPMVARLQAETIDEANTIFLVQRPHQSTRTPHPPQPISGVPKAGSTAGLFPASALARAYGNLGQKGPASSSGGRK
jgi:hypothetical protein